MTGIDDLRATLTHRADEVAASATDTVTRTAAVHQRVATVRRRRRAGAAAGMAAVLAVVGGVALLPSRSDGPDPATPTVAGLEAPQTLESVGWSYDFTDAVDGADQVRLDLAPSDVPRLVTWATAGADQTVQVRADGQRLTYRDDDFAGFVPVAPGSDGEVVLDGVGRLGLAVYELGDGVPAGVTRDGITFRRDVAGATLVDAAIGEAGAGSLELPVTPPQGYLGLAVLCTGAPEGSMAEVTLDGEDAYGLGCNDASTFDPGATLSVEGLGRGWSSVEVRVTDTDGDPVDADGVRLGLGVYRLDTPGFRTLRKDLPQVVEEDGRRWELARIDRSLPGDTSFRTEAGESGPWLVRLASLGRLEATVTIGRREQSVDVGVDGGAVVGLGLVDGSTTIKTEWADPTSRVALVFYRDVTTPPS